MALILVPRKCSGRECIDKCLDGVGILMELSAYPTDKMNDMTVILCFFIEINFYIVAVPAQVIAGKIDQHDVFGVFFGSFS